jgi:hypothetical protein
MTSATATETYNGWANYETWNVALWLQNDWALYNIARRYDDYSRFVNRFCDDQTPDGVSFNDPKLDIDALNELLADL